MRCPHAVVVLLLTAAVGMPGPAAAQAPVRSFDQLNTRLKAGDTVYVTDAQGREIVGKIRQLAPTSLVVDAGAPRVLGPQDVRLIEERPADSRKNGILWGLMIGAGGGIAAGAIEANSDGWTTGDEYLENTLIFGGIGAGAGVALGALFDGMRPGPRRVVFRAPGASGGAAARLSIAPVVTTRAKGVVVSFAF